MIVEVLSVQFSPPSFLSIKPGKKNIDLWWSLDVVEARRVTTVALTCRGLWATQRDQRATSAGGVGGGASVSMSFWVWRALQCSLQMFGQLSQRFASTSFSSANYCLWQGCNFLRGSLLWKWRLWVRSHSILASWVELQSLHMLSHRTSPDQQLFQLDRSVIHSWSTVIIDEALEVQYVHHLPSVL